MTQPVKFGVISLSGSSETGEDSEYLEWHQLDHMPQQWEIPGLVFGQRWVSTPECRAARAVETDRFAPVNHVMHYLWGEPLAPSIDDFFTLGAHLAKIGRFPYRLPAVMLGGFDLVATHADSTPPVTPNVLPFRPNEGMYLVLEASDRGEGPTAWASDDAAALLAVDGIAGFWHFNPGSLRTDRFDTDGFSATVCYLDGDPVATAGRLDPVMADRWKREAITPAFAAPFSALRPWAWGWEQHAQPGAPGT
jgi:hypothetical protein